MDRMNRMMLVAAMAAVTVGRLAAVTVGPNWCVAYPQEGSKEVNSALRVAAEEVADDINEATGLKLKAVPASKAKAPAIWIGAAFAKKAGFDLSGLKWYDNVIAEKGGSIYLFGNDRPGRDEAKFEGRVGWFRCVLPSVKAAARWRTARGTATRYWRPCAITTTPRRTSANSSMPPLRHQPCFHRNCGVASRKARAGVVQGMGGEA